MGKVSIYSSPDKVYYVKMEDHHLHNILINTRSKRNCVDIGSKSNIRTHNALLSIKAKSINHRLHNILINKSSKTADCIDIESNTITDSHLINIKSVSSTKERIKITKLNIINCNALLNIKAKSIKNHFNNILINISSKTNLFFFFLSQLVTRNPELATHLSSPAYQHTSLPAHCLRHCDESSKKQSLCFTRFFDFVFNQRTIL